MKKIIVLITLISNCITAQVFQGKATYKTFKKFMISSNTNGQSNSKQAKAIQEALRRQSQKTYILNFTSSESSYKMEAELPNSKPVNINGRAVTFLGNTSNSDVFYKNIKAHNFLNKKEASGKRFLIKDKLPNYNWELTGETKKIGKYTCYKATKTKIEEKSSFLMTDGERKERKQNVTVKTTVWYTPEIPVSNGPGIYGGLPGLILEVREGKKSIICSEITLNLKKSIKIEKPTKGKVVTQKKFDEIQDEKAKEFIERFRSKKSKKGNKNSISIEIGG